MTAAKKCARCERLLRRLRAAAEGEKMGDASLREHLRMAQESERLAQATANKHLDDALLSLLESVAFDNYFDWSDLRRAYDESPFQENATARDKVIVIIDILRRHHSEVD